MFVLSSDGILDVGISCGALQAVGMVTHDVSRFCCHICGMRLLPCVVTWRAAVYTTVHVLSAVKFRVYTQSCEGGGTRVVFTRNVSVL